MASASTSISSIKAFAESNGASPIPSNYHSFTDIDDVAVADELAASIPVFDFSLLTSDDPQIHAKAVQELAKACAEWGFFMLINHGVPESLMEELMKKSQEFHDLPVEEKMEFCDNGDPFSPIRHGNGKYSSVLHRAILNNKDTRISVVVLNGPAHDKEIGPAPQLLEKEKPLFKSIKYGDYFLVQQKSRFSEGRTLYQIRNTTLQ
ncbi:unnamed protein product [Lathyrus oleraceus]|uniref:Non-haem dioxygenase N-terminal domain-containing protein n=1 Tax=Pisum sativum TaxID=3888 RepID=A0A9D4WRZ6_PEA|nr:2-oxoglutarate-dependent dioxygenase 19-like [Pisum sativum]KAI5405601.1 hypothetical protein KIW84_052394 [Pisum sativum]